MSRHEQRYPTRDERQAMCGMAVTLNGKPAKVSGVNLDFARVTDKATGLSCEWAWPTVRRIIERGGKFQS